MSLAVALDRLAVVSANPHDYAIRKNEETLIRHGGGWMLSGSLDDRYLTSLQAVAFAADGEVIRRERER